MYKTLTEALFSTEGNDNKLTFVEQNEKITQIQYKEFVKDAEKMAQYFHKIGISKGNIVVLSVTNIRLLLSAFWGIIINGATVLPIIPPQNRKFEKDMLETSRLNNIMQGIKDAYLVTDKHQYNNRKEIIGESQPILKIEEDILDTDIVGYNYPAINEDDAAVILCTSGSTGKPKMVKISHKKALEGCYQNIDYFNYTGNNSFLNWLPIEHIASLTLYHMMPLILKANQVQIYTSIILNDAKKLLYYIDKYKVQATFAPDFFYGMLLDQEDEILKMDITLEHVIRIINGGQAINYKSCDACVRMLGNKGFPRTAMVPGWGMTEIGNGAVYSHNFGKILHNNCVAIGKPVKGLSVRVMKDGNLITEDGIEGSLEIKGDFILDGYINETEEEHKKNFTQDGFFVTGDLACYKEGELVITGRASDIFILNGNNISIKEIEEYMVSRISEDSIDTSIKVITLKNKVTSRDELYIFAKLNEEIDKQALVSCINRNIIKGYGFAFNRIVLVKGDFPRTSIGKIDSKTMVANMLEGIYEYGTTKVGNTHDESNYTDEENLMLFIWSDVLNIDKKEISVDDDFFLLGGNSSKVPEALSKINKAFDKNINAAEFVKYPTISKLLAYMNNEDRSDGDELDEECIILV